MSNQFPPAGNGQDPMNPNFGGNDAQSNAGYNASTGGYQGYTPQSDYQGYGQGGDSNSSYNSYGGDSSQSGYGSYGAGDQGQSSYGQGSDQQQSYGSYGSYGQQDQSQAQPGYGAYGQQDNQQQPAYAGYGGGDQQQSYGGYQPGDQGGYSGAPQQQTPKKKIAPWMMIVGAIAALALIGGLVWGLMAMLGGGAKYALKSDLGVDDVTFELNEKVAGEYWTESDYSDDTTFMLEDAEPGIAERCQIAGHYGDYTGDTPLEDYKGDYTDALDELAAESSGDSELKVEPGGTITLKDMKGEGVEFQTAIVTGKDYNGDDMTMHVAFHPFVDSNTLLTFMGTCEDGAELPGEFASEIKAIDFELTPSK